MESLLVLLLIANLVDLFLIWQRQDKQEKHLSKSLEDQADHLSDQLDYRFEQARQASQLDQKDLEVAVSDRLQEVRMELHQGLTQVRQEMTDNLLCKPGIRPTNVSKPCRNQMSNVWSKCAKRSKKTRKDLADTLAGFL